MTDFRTGYAQEQLARAETWLPSMMARVPEMKSADTAYAWLRDNDMYVPRSYVREVWGSVIRGADMIDIVNRLSETDIVPRSWMTETSFQYGAKYNYIMKIEGQDIASGEARKEYITVTSDENLTVGEAQGEAVSAAVRYGIATFTGDFSVSFDIIKIR